MLPGSDRVASTATFDSAAGSLGSQLSAEETHSLSLFCGHSLGMTGSFDYPTFPHLGGKSFLQSKQLPSQKSKLLLVANLEVLFFNELW